MLTLVALAVVAFPSEAIYRAEFVPVPGMLRRVQIEDARRDLQAVGSTSEGGTDWSRTIPLVVFRKSVVGDGPSSWIPMKILGKGSFVVRSVADGRHFTAKASKGTIRIGKATAQVLQRVPDTSVQNIKFSKELWGYRHPDPERYSPTEEAALTWQRVGGLRVGTVKYHGGPPGGPIWFHDWRYLPVIEVGGNWKRLREYVSGPRGLDLGDIAYVSPEGWMVVSADLKGKRGLAWLYKV